MKKCLMLSMFLIFIVGCGGLLTVTPETPLGEAFDPNQVQMWVDAAVAAGHTAGAAGTASGNPYLLGGGILLVTLGGLAAKIISDMKKG